MANMFEKSKIKVELFDQADISTMIWRASQPKNYPVPSSLNICNEYKIAFCGDWFDFEGFGRVEGAILSALNLAIKFKDLY